MSIRIFVVALLACLTAVARGQDKPAGDRGQPDRDPPVKSSDRKEPEPDAPAKPRSGKPPLKPDRAKAARADEAAVRNALKTLARSLQEGKADGIKQVLYAANPTERKMVDAMAAMAVQIAGLYKASVKAFGEDEARSLTGNLAAEMSRIDDADVTTDGDTATVRYRAPATSGPDDRDPAAAAAAAAAPPGETPRAAPATTEDAAADATPAMVLKRVDGRWRVPMAELSKDATPEAIAQRLADLDVQTRVIGDVAKEIAQGKYRSADKAAEAWQTRMMQALTPGKPPPAGDEQDQKQKPGGGKAAKRGEGDDATPEEPDAGDEEPGEPES